ncbi:winged helix-turn-helix domain-containing protein [Kribbella sp. NBC_00382]
MAHKFNAREKLPSQNDLATQYGVARMTIQQSLRILRDEGLIVSRVGSGVYVREQADQPVGLRPHIEKAFERAPVTIDFAGLTGETLLGALEEPIDRIRRGQLTLRAVTIRMLLPDLSQLTAVPSRAGKNPGDDPAGRARIEKIAHRSAGDPRINPRARQAGPGLQGLRRTARRRPTADVQALHPERRRGVLRLLPSRRARR